MIKGAYGPSAVYSMDEIKGLNEFANNRGVRLFMEVTGSTIATIYFMLLRITDCYRLTSLDMLAN